MPTIEIVSINSSGLELKQVDFEVAIIEEDKLISHRGLFYKIMKKQNGVIVHIGNPDFKNDKEGGFFAGAIVDWNVDPCEYIYIPENSSEELIFDTGANQQFVYKFLDQYKHDIDKLLKIALEKSPIKRIWFLTDYQFGPEKEEIEIIYTIKDFWNKHDTEGLRFNTMYEMYG